MLTGPIGVLFTVRFSLTMVQVYFPTTGEVLQSQEFLTNCWKKLIIDQWVPFKGTFTYRPNGIWQVAHWCIETHCIGLVREVISWVTHYGVSENAHTGCHSICMIDVVYLVAGWEEETVMTRLVVSSWYVSSVSGLMQRYQKMDEPIGRLEHGIRELLPWTGVQGIRASKFDQTKLVACPSTAGSRVCHKSAAVLIQEC